MWMDESMALRTGDASIPVLFERKKTQSEFLVLQSANLNYDFYKHIISGI